MFKVGDHVRVVFRGDDFNKEGMVIKSAPNGATAVKFLDGAIGFFGRDSSLVHRRDNPLEIFTKIISK